MSRSETLRVIHLNDSGTVLRIAGYAGSPDRVAMPLRTIMGDVVTLGSRSLILSHNHPLGDPTPSREDIALTRQLDGLLKAVDVRLHDHIVIGKGASVSFRSAGLL